MKQALLLLLFLGLALAQGVEALWGRTCAQCHGDKAQGVRPYPGLASALPFFATPEGRRYLVLVVLYGRKGEAGLMPGFYQLKDEEVARLLNHLKDLLKLTLRVDPGPKGEPFSPEEVARERGKNLTPDAVKRP
ncbi:cytochrome c [Thermus oshimai]|jgi:mono/diheme cytochrome c family protein